MILIVDHCEFSDGQWPPRTSTFVRRCRIHSAQNAINFFQRELCFTQVPTGKPMDRDFNFRRHGKSIITFSRPLWNADLPVVRGRFGQASLTREMACFLWLGHGPGSTVLVRQTISTMLLLRTIILSFNIEHGYRGAKYGVRTGDQDIKGGEEEE